jgi:hypothetical protein
LDGIQNYPNGRRVFVELFSGTMTAKWQEIVLDPRESLGTEIKGWLDLSLNEDRANLAQGLLALANHGGGVVLVGYREGDGSWFEQEDANGALRSFSTDAVNGVAERFADPPFHCELHIVEHAELRYPHPVIVVPGGHRVPVRAKRDGPDRKHVQKDCYYIRRPGPQSAPPQSAAEWQALIHRCVMEDRNALLDNLRAALTGETSRVAVEPSLEERTLEWERECNERFSSLVKERGIAETYKLGHFTCTYSFSERPAIHSKEFLNALQEAEHQTGWPVWMVFQRAPIAPYSFDGVIECLVHESEEREPAHADFWRASPEGRLFLLRGFQEDEPDNLKGRVAPGETLDRRLPMWRAGECLLHATRLAERLGVPNTALNLRMNWTGLAGRRLTDVFGDWPDPTGGVASRQNAVSASVTVDADRVRLQLTDLVCQLLGPLFEIFNFEVPNRNQVDAQLAKMLERTGGA